MFIERRAMKKSKKLFAIVAALILLLLTFICITFNGSVFSSDVAYADSGSMVDNNFKFTRIDVDITVGKDKVYTVKETLVTNFNRSDINRGLIRDIQHQTTTTRYINGKTVKGKSFIAKLDNVKAQLDGGSVRLDVEVSVDAYSIYMRKPSGYIAAGEHTFELEYTYDMSDDKMPGYDDFVFDVLGYEMNETEVFNATITFPENIDREKVSVRTNNAGYYSVHKWEPFEGESLVVSENTIKITAQPGDANKGYTVQVILPDGYFSEASVTFYWYYLIVIVALVAGIALATVLFLRFFLQGKTLEVVEYYPPEGLSVMEFSSIWHRGARAKDSAALILKWANLGLLTIERDGDKHLILRPSDVYDLDSYYSKYSKPKTSDIFSEVFDDEDEETEKHNSGGKTIQYLKSDKKYFDNLAEKKFYFRLFSGIGGEGIFSTRIFKDSSRYNKTDLYEDIKELVERGGDKKNLQGKAEAVRCALPFIGLIPTLALIIYYSILSSQFIPLFFFIFMAAGTFVGVEWRKNPQVIMMIIFPIVFYGVIYGVFTGLFTLTAYDYVYALWIAPIVWALCLFVLPFLVKGRRTAEAQKMYGRLKGFENFLLKAELPRIQLLFDENPDYFADILAWCVVMGISDKVLKRFASLNFKLPVYMENGMQVRWICSCMYHSHFHYSPVSHGGHSGGGGFSFGGGGGGHGGSFGGGGGGGGSRGC